jgi:hypothetical protein
MDKITFTLASSRAHSPCQDGYKLLCKNLGGVRKYGKDTPITLRQLYESNGYDDTLWCLRTTPKETHNLWRHFAVDVVSLAEHLITDKHSKNVLVVARKHADGKASDAELSAATDAAMAAARDAACAAQIDLLEQYCKHGKRPKNSEQLMKDLYQKHLKTIQLQKLRVVQI